jgi:zinc/manganese transport system substrate-binding protein
LRVVVSVPLLEDWVGEVLAGSGEVRSVLPRSADPHRFEPAPGDVASVSGADVVVVTGLSLDTWMDELVKNSGFKGRTIVAGRGVQTLCGGDHGHGADHGHDHGDADPHVWQDVKRAMAMVENIAEGLAEVDSGRGERYRMAGELYAGQLRVMDGWIKRALSRVPLERRVAVVSHDAFRYFSEAYGVRFIALAGTGAEGDVDAARVAAVVGEIRKSGVRAVFAESAVNPKLLGRVAAEAGVGMSGELVSDALGERGSAAGSYLGMMRGNVLRMLEAMR